MRNCIDEGTLQAWFDGELTANAAAEVTTHLNCCARCAEAARAVEAENLILAEGLTAEFAEAIPTERLRERVDAAVAGLQVRPVASQSWIRAVRDFFPSVRVLAYAAATAAIVLAGFLAVVYLRRKPASPVIVYSPVPKPSPQDENRVPPQVTGPVAQANVPPKLAPKSTKRNRAPEERATSLAWQERQYERAIAKL